MPKRSRSGVVSSPARVVAPISVNGGRSSVTTFAPAPWPIGDRQRPVLHRRIEGLLERAVQAVDLVDEEHRVRLERGEQRRDVALALERRAGRLHEPHAHLLGDDLRERRLAQAGRPGQEHVVERLAARDRRLHRDRELLADAVLADELLERARAQRAVEVVLAVEHAGRLDARAARSSARRLQRAGEQLLGRDALGALEQRLRLGGREAELEQALARDAAAGRRRA